MSPMSEGWDAGHVFEATGRQGRYGVAYVRDVCAQYGVGLSESSPDEDVNAVDLTIDFKASATRVQVKCTTTEFTQKDPHLRIAVKPKWVEKWTANINPTYLIAVKVPSDPATWIDYDDAEFTRHQTTAYWARIDTLPSQCRSIHLPQANLFTPETLRDWNTALTNAYSSEVTP